MNFKLRHLIMGAASVITVLSSAAPVAPSESPMPIASHPRLFADSRDFAEAKERLEKTEFGRAGLARILREADMHLGSKPPEYKLDLSGKRILAISRNAQDVIGKTAFAYRLTGDLKYARRAILEATTVCAFKDWNQSHFLDTAEMTFAVAIAYDWLYDVLSEEERTTLADSILHKGLTAPDGSLAKGYWVSGNNNWCQVCHGGLAAGAIATAERNPEISREIIDRAVKNLPRAMKVFSPDGGFPEGPASYWPYALEYNSLAIWEIEKFDGTDHGLCSLPGFAAEVEYLDACTGPVGNPFTFSDSGEFPRGKRGTTFAQWWLARRFNRPDTLVFFERNALKRVFAGPPNYGRDRFLPFTLLCLQDPPPDTKITSPLRRVINGSNPIAVMRTSWTDQEAWYAGLKGGIASASHGHMDIGSFVLDAKGVRWVYDLGCERYAEIEASEIGSKLWDSRQGSKRWTLFRYSTEGHGTLQFGNEQQKVDAVAKFSPLAKDGSVSLDMSTVYGRKVIRTFSLGENGGFVVRDKIADAHPGETVTWRIFTFAKADVSENKATLTIGNVFGKLCTMNVSATPADIVFEVADKSKRRLPYELDTPGLRQLSFTRTVPESGLLEFEVSFE